MHGRPKLMALAGGAALRKSRHRICRDMYSGFKQAHPWQAPSQAYIYHI